MMNLKDMIDDRKKLIKKYDNVLRFAINDLNCNFDDIEKIKKRRDDLIDELIALSNNPNIREQFLYII